MTTRWILSLPLTDTAATLEADALRAALIAEYAARWAGPMPGTVDCAGRYVTDVLTSDEVTATLLASQAPTWQVLGCWRWDGSASVVTPVIPLDTVEFAQYLPIPLDPDTGLPTGTAVSVVEVHRWAGWPDCWEAAP